MAIWGDYLAFAWALMGSMQVALEAINFIFKECGAYMRSYCFFGPGDLMTNVEHQNGNLAL